jgi:hypothetical protein
MNLSAFLSSLADAQTYPFFGGWRCPDPANRNAATVVQVTLADNTVVVLDPLPGTHSGTALLRAYYTHLSGGCAKDVVLDLYVRNYGQPTEEALFAGDPLPRQEKRLTLAGIASATDDPVAAAEMFSALESAAKTSPDATTQSLLKSFLPLLEPGSGAGLDVADPATAKALDYLASKNVLSEKQVTALKALATVEKTAFKQQ